ncbi:MAG: site-2 protease family protein [Proteobacteria bacterium]|nr:site-2 protease family protein [Pseudomonadota bacterium]
MQETILQIAIYAFPVLLSITVHEFFHGYSAYKLGDPTAKMLGRLTFNPFAHIDLFGTILLPLILIITNSSFLIAWAKPVPINPLNFKRPYRDMALSSLAGPLSNIILCIIFFVALTFFFKNSTPISGYGNSELIKQMLRAGFFMNFALFAFNMLPIPPLDGSKVLTAILPKGGRIFMEKIEPYGFFIVLGLLFFRIIDLYMLLMANLLKHVLIFIGGF